MTYLVRGCMAFKSNELGFDRNADIPLRHGDVASYKTGYII
jgi:hypothetical protein